MSHRIRPLFLVAGLVAGIVVVAPSASAVDQDLVVSAANGPPGTVITVTSASCVSEPDAGGGGIARSIEAQLIVGTAPDELLAGRGRSNGKSPPRILVPDWVDPDQPAMVEATCSESNFTGVGPREPVETIYDPAPFDIEPGSGPPSQTATFSRTSLLQGQAALQSVAACDLGADPDRDLTVLFTVVYPGDVRDGRRRSAPVAISDALLEGPSYEAPFVLGNSAAFFETADQPGPPVVARVQERPSNIAPGTYTVLIECRTLDRSLAYEPQLIEVTGSAPVADVDLVVTPGSRMLVVSGGSCDAGPVDITLWTEDFADGLGRSAGRRSAGRAEDTNDRMLVDNGYAVVRTAARPDGTWRYEDEVGFDRGAVYASAACGDPLGDGFVYNDQIAIIDVPPDPPIGGPTTTAPTTTAPTPTAPSTGPTTAPAPVVAPGAAEPITGSPDYTG